MTPYEYGRLLHAQQKEAGLAGDIAWEGSKFVPLVGTATAGWDALKALGKGQWGRAGLEALTAGLSLFGAGAAGAGLKGLGYGAKALSAANSASKAGRLARAGKTLAAPAKTLAAPAKPLYNAAKTGLRTGQNSAVNTLIEGGGLASKGAKGFMAGTTALGRGMGHAAKAAGKLPGLNKTGLNRWGRYATNSRTSVPAFQAGRRGLRGAELGLGMAVGGGAAAQGMGSPAPQFAQAPVKYDFGRFR